LTFMPQRICISQLLDMAILAMSMWTITVGYMFPRSPLFLNILSRNEPLTHHHRVLLWSFLPRNCPTTG
jgi:hypothetical protein